MPLKEIEMEVDCQFVLVSGYPNLHRFANGVFTENYHWTVHEYKAMRKVTVGMLAGLCPSEGIRLIREYLHIHHLSHYPAYMHTLLEWLQSAIDIFWSMLRHPQGPWVRNSLVSPDYEPQRLHYFSYYVASVHAKGALLSYSTDRMKIHHKPFKRTWQTSNKNGDAEMIILKKVI